MDAIERVRAAESYPAVLAAVIVTAIVYWLWTQLDRKREAAALEALRDAAPHGDDGRRATLPLVDLERCFGSGACVSACPEKNVLGVVAGRAKLLKPAACSGCAACMHACPMRAITMA